MSASFKDYNFKPFINDAINDLGFKNPTPIQAKVIPTIRHGKSVIGKSATGSGKTHSIVSYDLHGIFDRESWACKR